MIIRFKKESSTSFGRPFKQPVLRSFLYGNKKAKYGENARQKEKIMTLKEAIPKDGQRHLYVNPVITSGTTQYINFLRFDFLIYFSNFQLD